MDKELKHKCALSNLTINHTGGVGFEPNLSSPQGMPSYSPLYCSELVFLWINAWMNDIMKYIQRNIM